MKNLLVLVFAEFMLAGTTIHIGCFGLPIEDDNEDPGSSSRLTRSLHALHSQLCPEGSNSERCFYSQLSMFMRMQDSLMDPVALRNIGKRNIASTQNDKLEHIQNKESSNTAEFGLDLMSDPSVRLLQIKHFAAMLNDIKKLFDTADANADPNAAESSQIQSFLFNPSELSNGKIDGQRQRGNNNQGSRSITNMLHKTDHETSIDNLIERFLGAKTNTGNENSEVIQSQMKRNIARYEPQQKRQIICSSTSSRLECYDNALAYYVRLLKTLKSH